MIIFLWYSTFKCIGLKDTLYCTKHAGFDLFVCFSKKEKIRLDMLG